MGNINHQTLSGIGNITKDIEVRTSKAGVPYATIGVAVNGAKKDQPLYLLLSVGGKTAENAAKYLRRGDQVGFVGKLRSESWEKDGQKHYRTVVFVSDLAFGNKVGEKQSNMNYVSYTAVGNLVADPVSMGEGRVAAMDIAINDPFDKESQLAVVRVKCSGTTAKNVLKYLHKGTQVAALDASLQGESWERDGQKYYRVVAWSDNIQFGNASRQMDMRERSLDDGMQEEKQQEDELGQEMVVREALQAVKEARSEELKQAQALQASLPAGGAGLEAQADAQPQEQADKPRQKAASRRPSYSRGL